MIYQKKDLSPPERLAGRASLDDLFPGFDADALAQVCVSRQVPFAELKRALRGDIFDTDEDGEPEDGPVL